MKGYWLLLMFILLSFVVSSTELTLPDGSVFNINIITATQGNGTGWNQTGTSLYPSQADSLVKDQTLSGSGNSCLQVDNDGIISTTGTTCSGTSSTFDLKNVSNTTSISRILDANLLARVGDFDLRNIS